MSWQRRLDWQENIGREITLVSFARFESSTSADFIFTLLYSGGSKIWRHICVSFPLVRCIPNFLLTCPFLNLDCSPTHARMGSTAASKRRGPSQPRLRVLDLFLLPPASSRRKPALFRKLRTIQTAASYLCIFLSPPLHHLAGILILRHRSHPRSRLLRSFPLFFTVLYTPNFRLDYLLARPIPTFPTILSLHKRGESYEGSETARDTYFVFCSIWMHRFPCLLFSLSFVVLDYSARSLQSYSYVAFYQGLNKEKT